MAARLTDEQKKRIIADYVESGSYRATAKKFGVSDNTVKKICNENAQIAQKCAQKKEQNTSDMLAYMESRKEQAKGIIDDYLKALADPAKLEEVSIPQIATAMGIVIDKFVTIPAKHQIDRKRLDNEREKLELEKKKVESQIKEDSGGKFDQILQNMDALAERIRTPVPDRDIEDYE